MQYFIGIRIARNDKIKNILIIIFKLFTHVNYKMKYLNFSNILFIFL